MNHDLPPLHLPSEGERYLAGARIPPRFNLGAALTAGNVALGRGDRVCVMWENSAGASRRLTYAELDAQSSRFASSLDRLGVRPGQRILLRLPNLPEFYIAALGIAKLGAVFIPSSTQYRAAEIAYRLRDAEVVAVVTTTGLAEEAARAIESSGSPARLILVDYNLAKFGAADANSPAANRPAGALDFEQLLADGREDFVAADTAADDVAFLAYTSGTTGEPKGVVHAHGYPLAYDSLVRLWHDYREEDICACPAEVGWMLPVASTFLYALRCGLQVVLYHALDGRFHPEAWLDLLARRGVTNFVGTPTIYRMLTACENTTATPALRHGVSAGEPLPADTLAAVRERFGFTPLDGIGMSECMVYCFNRAGDEILPGSCGRPAPGIEIRLLDEELREVAAGQEGVLCVRRDDHPGMMREYLNKPGQTAEVFRGPWYWSGDVLSQDAQGRFWFKGRADDVIKASGYRISPFEVEACLVEHPAVLEAAAVSTADAVRGQVVKAVIVLRAGKPPSDELATELQDWVKTRLAPYKYPRVVEFRAELPKTQSGKILRRQLRG